MNVAQALIFGLVQGLTEFLPISSSGHLILLRELIGLSLENTLAFDVWLHLATLCAIVIYFWGDLRRLLLDFRTEGLSTRSNKLIWALILGVIPAGLFGYFGSDFIENTFRNPEYVAYALIGGSLVFFLADLANKWGQHGGINPIRGFAIGVFQALALIPGVSRSGITISGGLFAGLSRIESIRFAFLLGIPAILGAAIKTLFDSGLSVLMLNSYPLILNSAVAFATALLSGLWAVKFLVRYLSTHNFNLFVFYRILLAGVILFLL